MISAYFGVPGVGKTTMLTALAQKELKRMRKGKSRYSHVLTNFYCQGCEKFSVKDLGRYKFENCLILIDEITLDVDSRDYKSFSVGLKEFFILHRHLHNDIIYFCQDYSRCDKTIRDMTNELWYLKRSVLPFFGGFTIAKRIFRNININEYTSELTIGYRFASFTESIFTKSKKIFIRRKWYKYFDSFDEGNIANREVFNYGKW